MEQAVRSHFSQQRNAPTRGGGGTWFELESTVQRFASATLNESPKWFYLKQRDGIQVKELA